MAHASAIEGFAIEPIPDALKTVRWPDLFLLVSNFLINPSTILVGGLAVAAGLSFWATMLTSTLGILIAFTAYIVMATVGVDYGITGQVACRMVFGIQGAKWLPSIMRTIASAYWFAMQTIVGATVIVAIRHQWTGGTYSVVRTGLVLAALQVGLALVGYHWLKLISRFSLPVKVAGIVYLFWILAHGRAASYRPAPRPCISIRTTGWAWALGAVWLNSMTAAWLTMITDAADFCRYTRSRKDMWWGTMLARVAGHGVFGFAGRRMGPRLRWGGKPNPFSLAAGSRSALADIAGIAGGDRARRIDHQCHEPVYRRPFACRTFGKARGAFGTRCLWASSAPGFQPCRCCSSGWFR